MKKTRSIYLALIAVLVSPIAANADVIVFTDRLTWEAAVSGTIDLETFDNDIAHATVIEFDNGIISTATPDTTSSGNQVSGGEFLGYVDSFIVESTPDILTWDFPDPITAFGADFTQLNLNQAQLNISSLGFSALLHNTIGGTDGFFGLVSDISFSQIFLDNPNGGDFFTMDNLATVAAVPEPGTLALFGIGLAAMGLVRRRKRSI